MSLGFEHAMLLVSAYCDPVKTLRHAQQLGYHCTSFRVATLPFGTYSSEPKVAFPLTSCLLVSSVFFAAYVTCTVLLIFTRYVHVSSAALVSIAVSVVQRQLETCRILFISQLHCRQRFALFLLPCPRCHAAFSNACK